MKHADLSEANCAISRSAAIVGERWVWAVLRQAFTGARRFADIRHRIGLSANVLADRLNALVDQGIPQRQRYTDPTARELHECELTAKGRALFPVYVALMNWGNRWTSLPAPPVDLLHKPCAHCIGARVVCSECGQDFDAGDTKSVVGPAMSTHHRVATTAN